MRSKLVIDKINEVKMKLGSKVILRKAGKAKVDSEFSMKAVNSAKRKESKKLWIWDRVKIDCLAQTGC